MVDNQPRGIRQWLGVYVRGMAMGVAELVPGVSGGTIAFVTGIYAELVDTLAGLKITRLAEFRAGIVAGFETLWRELNLTFLLVLGLGMVTSVVLLAQVLSVALDTVRPVVWSFFFGIIVLSIWFLGRELPKKSLLTAAPVGFLIGLSLLFVEPFGGSESLPVFFFAGCIAVSAWLLPAISGSFVLLILGLYEPVLAAVSHPGWLVLLTFLSGCLTGLLLFSRFLSALLRVWRDPLLAGLTGFMAGALMQLWPWQSDGLLTPNGYRLATGEPDFLLAALVAVLLGGGAIWLLSRLEQ